MNNTVGGTLNYIVIDAENCASAFGPLSSHLLLHHRAMLDELHTGGIKQGKVNRAFEQDGWNRFFAVDQDGNVRVAGTLREHVMRYMQDGYVLVQRMGCGKPTHVIGTNGGTMACGGKLTAFGKVTREYCAECNTELA